MLINKFTYKLIILTISSVLILGSISSANASEGPTQEIDISNGYISELITLDWMANTSYQFEVTQENTNYTFELVDVSASLFSYTFEPGIHEGDAVPLSLSHGSGQETGRVTSEGLPMGQHIGDVVRHLSSVEIGNYTLEISNAHEHPADPVEFKIKFSVGLNGDEVYGDIEESSETTTNETPGFQFLTLLGIIPLYLVMKKEKE